MSDTTPGSNARWRASEIAFWILALLAPFLFPSRYLDHDGHHSTGVFALSLDLILGYAGRFARPDGVFGIGAYAPGLLACMASSPTRGRAWVPSPLPRRSAFPSTVFW